MRKRSDFATLRALMPRAKQLMRFPSQVTVARLRALKWRQRPGQKLRHERDAAEFLKEVQLCLFSPVRGLLLPSFQEAVAGRPWSGLGGPDNSHRDSSVTTWNEVLYALIQQRVVFETNCLWRTPVLVARELFPSLYAIVGDADPEEDYREQQRRGELSVFEVAVYEVVLREGPVVRSDLRSSLNLSTEKQEDSLERALHHLWRTAKIVRAGYTAEHSVTWDAFFRWAPEVIRDARAITRLEAAMRILDAYVDEAVVVARAEAQKMFSGFLTREVCNRAIELLIQSGRVVESRGNLAGSGIVSR